jgi:hypothetical protein
MPQLRCPHTGLGPGGRVRHAPLGGPPERAGGRGTPNYQEPLRGPMSSASPPPLPAGALRLSTMLLGDLVVPDDAARAAELQALSARAAVYATRARGEGTRRAYRSAWSAYETWCASLGREPLAGDPKTLAMHAVRCADHGLAVASLRVHLAAIQAALAQVMRQTRHRSADVALGYLRPASLWRNNPTRGMWGGPGDAADRLRG